MIVLVMMLYVFGGTQPPPCREPACRVQMTLEALMKQRVIPQSTALDWTVYGLG